MPYKRVLLKVSGAALGEDRGIDGARVGALAEQVQRVTAKGVQLAIVVGGGNIFRGSEAAKAGMDRATADYAGMLATIINALALQDALERRGVPTRTQSAIEVRAVAESYIRRRAVRHLEKGRVVIFAAGTGNPYMTTDTAASLRAVEIGAEVLLMAKNKVNGVYDSDPRVEPAARRFAELSYLDALNLRVKVIDSMALSLCMENSIPIIVFDIQAPHGVERAVEGQRIGTLITAQSTITEAR